VSEERVLIYDGDCQFCQLSLDWGIRHLKRFPKYVAFQRVNLADFGLTKAQAQAQIWLVDTATSKSQGGHLAAAEILRMQPGLAPRAVGALMKVQPFSFVASKIYGWVAKNRHRLPGGTRACKLEDNFLG
jgi:predicted DCC family thiol-disulfide oxidoreductase YuxK